MNSHLLKNLSEDLIQSSLDGILAFDRECRYLLWNPAMERISGLEKSKVLGKCAFEVFPFLKKTGEERYFLQALEGKNVIAIERPYTIPETGRNGFFEGHYSPLRGEGGEIVGGMAIIRDITERKRTEEGLSLLQTITVTMGAADNLDSALSIALEKICQATGWALGQAWIPRSEGTALQCSPAWYCSVKGMEPFRVKSKGMTFAPGIGLPGRVWSSKTPIWIVDVVSDPNFPRASTAREVGLQSAMAIPVLAGKEVVAVIEFFVLASRREDEQLIQVVSSVAAQLGSVVQQKRMEEALRETNQMLQALIEASPLAIIALDHQARVKMWNPAAERIFGWRAEEALGRFNPIIPKEKREEFRKLSGDVLQGKTLSGIEVSRQDKSGSRIDLSLSSAPLRDAKGNIWGVMGILSDMTERKRAEEELKRTLSLLTATLESTADGILVVDRKGKITRFNRKFIEMWAIPDSIAASGDDEKALAHMLGQLDNPDRFLEKARDLYTKLDAESYDLLESKDGRVFERYSQPQRIEGESVGRVWSFRDITQRKRAEEQLKKSREQLRLFSIYLQSRLEEERTHIAREIHDEIGQTLTVLKMELAWLQKRFPKNRQELQEKAQSMSALIDAAIQTVRETATELRPGILDDLGLTAAIEWQAQEFEKRTGILCRSMIAPEDLTVDPDRSTALFRILQETLTNIARHAKATQINIQLMKQENLLILHVKDNGIGITEGQATHSKSLGLLGIRERVHLWGGEVTIQGAEGGGTVVHAELPLEWRTEPTKRHDQNPYRR